MSQPNNSTTPQNPVGRFMVAVGAVIEHEITGKILLVQRSADLDWHNDQWEIIYGRIDQFEDTLAGLKREVFEEVGLKNIEVGQILSVWHIFRGEQSAQNELIGVTYYVTTTTEAVNISSEHAGYRWVTPEEALQLVKVEGIQRDIKKYIEFKSSQKVKIGKDVIGVGVGALIFNDEGKLLLTLRGKKAKNEVGKWEIPGGAVDFGETLEQAITREVKEELDLEIEVGEMLQLCDHIIPDEKQHWVSPTYICKVISGTPKITEPEKCEEIGWFTIEEAEKLPLSIVTKADIQVLKRRNREIRK